MSHLNNEIEKQVLKLEDFKKQLEAKSNNIYVTMGQNFGKVAAKDFMIIRKDTPKTIMKS